MKIKNNIPYITLTWNAAPRSEDNIIEFECVSALIRNKDTGLFLVLEFIQEEFWLVGWKIEEGETSVQAVIRETEEESGYKDAKIIQSFWKLYSRWYKARKQREEETLENIFFVEVEEKNKSEALWMDYGTKNILWFSEKEAYNKITYPNFLYLFDLYLKTK